MLIDLFADCLPNRKKKRWHFTTFMLETFSKLEYLRRSRQTIIPASLGQQEDYSLLWLARDMISTSPILFLDEFQLPDRAATKIITNLFTSFFQLGGVLICTSNRMPEELAKAAGMEFAPPPSSSGSLNWRFGLGGGRAKSKSDSLFSGAGDFALFLEVLKARCEVWEIESGKDYRRRESEEEFQTAGLDTATNATEASEGFEGLEAMLPGNVGLGYEQSVHQAPEQGKSPNPGLPKNYFVKPADSVAEQDRESWIQSYNAALARCLGNESAASHNTSSWNSSSMRVYGRNVSVPRQSNGVSQWTFLELCCTNLGPADYISLASTFHTLILTDVPILTLLEKNEARRFITLLDALYEARCKLIITADAGPDDLFFPETKQVLNMADPEARERQTVTQDAVYAETFAEAYQDATAPFRPNISMYDPSSSHSEERNTMHSRFAGFFSDDQLEDQPPNTPHRGGQNNGISGQDEASLDERDMRNAQNRGPDFSRATSFTGEDEKFAYKRARSRLWEMCGARWWSREEEEWWKPVDRAVRRWEGSVEEAWSFGAPTVTAGVGGGSGAAGAVEGAGASREVDEKSDEVMFRHGASPFRRSEEPPPKFDDTHVWGVAKWGRRAGVWGKGVEGLGERGKERETGREMEREKERKKEEGLKAGGDGGGDGHGTRKASGRS